MSDEHVSVDKGRTQHVLNYDVKSGQIKNKHKEGTSRDDVISCNYREYWGGSHD